MSEEETPILSIDDAPPRIRAAHLRRERRNGVIAAVLIFFAWGFVMHAAGLLLHELGGHALASRLLACGIDGYDLTYFGHGVVHYARCERWTPTKILVADWAGLVLTIAAGTLSAVVVRRRRASLSPMARLLLALLAFFFLLGQLGYATSGGFHDLYDPGRTARRLGAAGLHVLAWVPPLLAYAAAAFVLAREIVQAFREQFASRSRLHTLAQLAGTLGVSGLLYWLAFRIEWTLRSDIAMRGVAHEAERRAVAAHAAKPFPIDLVLLGVALAAVVFALTRPVTPAPDPRASPAPLTRRVATTLLTTTALFVVLMIALVRR